MAGQPLRPFNVNGWTIEPAQPSISGMYRITYTEGHACASLESAVRTAQKASPNLISGTPEQVDARLRELMTDEQRLAFYQWIGRMAVGEAVSVATENVSRDPAPPQHRSYSQDTVYEFFGVIDPCNESYDPFPSKLPENIDP
jgi:hypothetical protein